MRFSSFRPSVFTEEKCIQKLKKRRARINFLPTLTTQVVFFCSSEKNINLSVSLDSTMSRLQNVSREKKMKLNIGWKVQWLTIRFFSLMRKFVFTEIIITIQIKTIITFPAIHPNQHPGWVSLIRYKWFPNEVFSDSRTLWSIQMLFIKINHTAHYAVNISTNMILDTQVWVKWGWIYLALPLGIGISKRPWQVLLIVR